MILLNIVDFSSQFPHPLAPCTPVHKHTECALGPEFQMCNGHITLPFQELKKFKLKILTTTS